MPDLSSLLFGGGWGCPWGCSTRRRFISVAGGRSISDQKNLDGLSPVKKVWMARDGWRSEIPWTCEVNHPTNWERGSSPPWTNPRREAMVGLGRALAKKFNSNSFANRSNEDIEAGLRREYQVLAGPLRVVGKARNINVQGHLSMECSGVLCWVTPAIVRLDGRESEGGRERLVFLNQIAGATLRPSWRRSRESCASFYGGSASGGALRFRVTGHSVCGGAVVRADCAWTWLVRPRKASAVTTDHERRREKSFSKNNSGSALLWRPPWLAEGGKVGSRRDPSDGQVSSVVHFSIPQRRRGAGAFIVSAIGYSYLISLLPLFLTISSYLSTTPVVLAMRHAPAGKGCRPYLC
ncbi:hypothetical protein BHE74_00040293 [Ensete ventricosum]|nr:hypothetical protein BHE74_00040293 [Ensete ventricosum]